ncbi:MAG: membrane dipeptidase [Clostridia bacterium]|nr:membrane dipeptidase [Clostridia bacterium]
MIFDGHGDIWTDVTCRRIEHQESDVFRRRHLKKFREGNVTGGIFVIWIDPPHDKDPVKRSAQIVESIRAEQREASDILQPVTCFRDFETGKAAGKINVVTGMEGLSQIGEDINRIDYFYEEVGVRHAMLTWNEQNALAAGWPQDKEQGLTKAGVKAVKRIRELGMVMDVSHLNDKGFWDVMRLAGGPVIASHSNARSICPAMRNLSDDMLKEIGRTDGLVGMNSLREFIDGKYENQNVERLADHVEYIADLIGIRHLGLGYDFDDYLGREALGSFSSNLDSPSGRGVSNEAEAGNLLRVLKERGYTDDELSAVAYGNFFRVFKATWK